MVTHGPGNQGVRGDYNTDGETHKGEQHRSIPLS